MLVLVLQYHKNVAEEALPFFTANLVQRHARPLLVGSRPGGQALIIDHVFLGEEIALSGVPSLAALFAYLWRAWKWSGTRLIQRNVGSVGRGVPQRSSYYQKY